MIRNSYDLIVVGGGPAGLAAACAAHEKGLKRILLVERDKELGGILNQCIHNGFGLHYFKEELTGPEYARRFAEAVEASEIDVLLDTMVLDIKSQDGSSLVQLMGEAIGYQVLHTKALVLTMGCRERTRGAIQIPGSRPAGIFTAGTAQRYVNIEGYMVGRRVLILGSGDIGLIMARRMTLEGAKVLACVELMPFSGGLNRNIVQCLNDYDIPLLLSHTITEIKGKDRVEEVTVQKVDASFKPIPGTEISYAVDTVLLSVGLIPENELSRQAGIALDPRTNGPLVNQFMACSLPGIYAAGNVLHVHDLVDFVTEEAKLAGAEAAAYVLEGSKEICGESLVLETAPTIAYTVPQRIDRVKDPTALRIFFRVRQNYKEPMVVVLSDENQVIQRFKKPFMAPGEMQSIRLSKGALEKITGSKLRLAIEEV